MADTKKAILLGRIYREVSSGRDAAYIAEKHQLSITESREIVDYVRRANRQALHNRVKGMFLMGHAIAELPKYFGLTESEIRVILQPKEKSGE